MLSPLCSLWPLLAALLLGWLLCGWFARQLLRRDGTPSESAAWTSFQRVYLTFATVFAFILVVSAVGGFGPGGRACKLPGMTTGGASAPRAAAAQPAAPAPAEAPKAASAEAAVPASPPAPAAPSSPPPAAKLYFPPDKTTLPPNTVAALLPVVNYLKANTSAKASISGFHDASGRRARNEALALDRARAARGALERAGITRERIALQKPAVTTGGSAAREARRVEVAVQTP